MSVNYRSQFTCLLIIIVGTIFSSGCTHRMAPTTSGGGTYQASSDRTVYSVDPYGSVALPGNWETGKYNKASRQQYFYHKDTATMVVSIGACRSFPFGKGPEGYDFVKKYYEVEVRYQTQLLDQKPVLLAEDPTNKYMIWMVRQDGIDQYYLCGVKDCSCKECSYRTLNLKSRKYTAEQAKKLLLDVFMES